jgi:NTE family protein
MTQRGLNGTHGDSRSQSPVDYEPASGSLPLPIAQRRGVALCMSGGGYRAALFHLGALRRLNEIGVLSRVTTISSVSGGSILAAHLARQIGSDWPREGQFISDWVQRVEVPFRALSKQNIRTRALLSRWLPWNWFDSAGAAKALRRYYAERLHPGALPDLPDRPRYVFCATDMAHGVNWIFSRDCVGSYLAGYLRPEGSRFGVATAVAASSCFPPVFNPLPADVSATELRSRCTDGKPMDAGPSERAALIAGLRLSDGGVYDNLGLEPVWKRHRHVLVSDGGAVFRPEIDRGLLWRLNRYTAIQGAQVTKLRKRWLMASFLDAADESLEGTYWGIGSATSSYPGREDGSPAADGNSEQRSLPRAAGYSKALVTEVVSRVRTDMDRFSSDEADVLMNHGYLLAEAATLTYTPDLRNAETPLARPPNERLLDEAGVRRALADSHRNTILGRW